MVTLYNVRERTNASSSSSLKGSPPAAADLCGCCLCDFCLDGEDDVDGGGRGGGFLTSPLLLLLLLLRERERELAGFKRCSHLVLATMLKVA